MIGIYGFRNKLNNKWYIGQSINIERRYKQHLKIIDNIPTHLFDYQLKEIGIENFEFVILKECSKEDLNEYEKYYIKLYKSNINGYNKTKGGKCYPDNYKYYEHHLEAVKNSWTDERRKKHSEQQKIVQKRFYESERGKECAKHHSLVLTGRKLSEETKKKMSETRKGHLVSDETRLKISQKLTGREISKETKKRLSESHKGRSPGNKGIPMSEAQKQLLSSLNKGKHRVYDDENHYHYE